MSKPINKVFMGQPSEAWYHLTLEERNQFLAKISEAQAKFGVKSLVYCDSSWSSDKYSFFGVEEFPSFEALQGYHAYLAEIEWTRYVTEKESLLGTSYSTAT
jgi:hypothetical protein